MLSCCPIVQYRQICRNNPHCKHIHGMRCKVDKAYVRQISSSEHESMIPVSSLAYCLTISFTASSKFDALYLPFGAVPGFVWENTFFESFAYAWIVSSTDMRRRPSIKAMRLWVRAWDISAQLSILRQDQDSPSSTRTSDEVEHFAWKRFFRQFHLILQ